MGDTCIGITSSKLILNFEQHCRHRSAIPVGVYNAIALMCSCILSTLKSTRFFSGISFATLYLMMYK